METNTLLRNVSSIKSLILIMHDATVERKNSLLTRRNLWQSQTERGRPSASTSRGLRGQERGDNRHHISRPWTPAEEEKHQLKTPIMSYVHAE